MTAGGIELTFVTTTKDWIHVQSLLAAPSEPGNQKTRDSTKKLATKRRITHPPSYERPAESGSGVFRDDREGP